MTLLLQALLVPGLTIGCATGGPAAGPSTPGAVALPPVDGPAEYQIGGAYEPASSTRIVLRDMTARPAPGIYSICYVNAFQTQPGDDWSRLPVLRDARDAPVIDPDWPDEALLDISTESARDEVMRVVVAPALEQCAERGFDAVEPDNLDSWTRSRNLLTADDAAALARSISERAHGLGLAVGQKNAVELLDADLGTDFAILEECQVYDECNEAMRRYGRHIIEIEYTRTAFRAACAENGDRWSIILRDRAVSTPGSSGHVAEKC